MAREERYLAMAARQRNGNSGGSRKRFVATLILTGIIEPEPNIHPLLASP